MSFVADDARTCDGKAYQVMGAVDSLLVYGTFVQVAKYK
jgi:hypothetical protein